MRLSEFFCEWPGECDELSEIIALKLWIFLIDLLDLIGSFSSEDQCAHVDEHRKAHGVDEFELMPAAGVRWFEGIEEDGVPDGKRADEPEFASVDAADPAKEEGLRADILQFEDPK